MGGSSDSVTFIKVTEDGKAFEPALKPIPACTHYRLSTMVVTVVFIEYYLMMTTNENEKVVLFVAVACEKVRIRLQVVFVSVCCSLWCSCL